MNRPLPDPHAALEARIAQRIAARLNEQAERLDPDLVERLRHARERALQAARAARAPQPVAVGGVLAGRASAWWMRLGAALPLVALVCGLVLIQKMQTASQVAVAAEVDAALLSDDLPPSAYSDAGFAEYLKTSSRL